MANKLNQIVRVNTVKATSSVLTTSVNTVAIVVTGAAKAANEYSDLDSVVEDFAKTSAAYKMAQTHFSQQTHPDKLVIITAVSGSSADIIDAVESASSFDFFHIVLEYTLVDANASDKATAGVAFVKALNTKANEISKVFRLEVDCSSAENKAALKLMYTMEGGLTESKTTLVDIWAHDMVATAIKRVATITAVTSTLQGSKKVTVTIGSSDYEADTTSSSTAKSIVDDLVAEINAVDACPFAAANSDDKLVLTAKIGGTGSNSTTISVASTDSGVSVTKSSDVNGEVSPEHLGVAITSQRCGVDPARGTWAHKKSLVGITPDKLTAAEVADAKASGYNIYTTVAGEARTFMGTTCGPTDFIDTNIKCFWIKFNVEAEIYRLLGDANEGYGVTYDDTGIQAIGAVISKVLTIAADSLHQYIMEGYTVNVPTYASIAQAEKDRRNVPTINGNYSVMNYVNTVLDVTLNIVYPEAA